MDEQQLTDEVLAMRRYREHAAVSVGVLIAGLLMSGGMSMADAEETAHQWGADHDDAILPYERWRRIAPLSDVVAAASEPWWDAVVGGTQQDPITLRAEVQRRLGLTTGSP